jgi:plastocyanin
MPPDGNTTDTRESSDEPITERALFERRPLLKALGVGATLSLGSGVAAGTQDGGEIDPNYGYAVQDGSEIPESLRPDHEVSLAAAEFDPNAELPILFYFDPAGLHASTGDIVQFTFDSPDHTVTSYHEALGFQTRVPEEAPPFSSPIVAVGGAWLYRFDHAGVYDLYCGPHHVLGMVMRVVVGDLDEADYPAYLETPEELPPFGEEFENILVQFSDANEEVEWVFPTPREMLTASALDPGRIQEEQSVSFGTVRDELTETAAETTTR